MDKIQSKYEHRAKMVQIGIQAVEHALRFLSQDNLTRKLIEQRLVALRSGDTKKLIATIRPETEYTQESCLRRASEELLKLSVSEKWLSGSAITSRIFTPCWDSLHFTSSEEMDREMDWQYKNLSPLIEKAFEHVRNSEKVSAA